jgi:hypothetical protein
VRLGCGCAQSTGNDAAAAFDRRQYKLARLPSDSSCAGRASRVLVREASETPWECFNSWSPAESPLHMWTARSAPLRPRVLALLNLQEAVSRGVPVTWAPRGTCPPFYDAAPTQLVSRAHADCACSCLRVTCAKDEEAALRGAKVLCDAPRHTLLSLPPPPPTAPLGGGWRTTHRAKRCDKRERLT